MTIATQITGYTQQPFGQTWTRQANLHILTPQDVKLCHFWMVFCQKGEVRFEDVKDSSDFRTTMHEISMKGYQENHQTMLVDGSEYQNKYLYILPEFEKPTFFEKALWMTSLAKQLKEMKINSLGVYLRNESLVNNNQKQLIMEIFRQLCITTNISNYYFLVGIHDVNLLLNFGIEVKNDLQQEGVNLLLFH